MSCIHLRILICTVILGAAFLSAPAQGNGPSSSALLEGSVVNKVTGAPVRHAHVMYIKVPSQGSNSLSTDTDSDGHFSVSLEAGSYRLWAERPGFAHQAYGSRTPEGTGTVLTLASGQQMRDISLSLVPFGAIAGHVVDEDGEPIQGVGIQVLRFSFATGRRQLIPVTGVSTNDRGEYRAYNLPAGRYYLLANLRGAPLSRPPEIGGLVPELQQAFAAVYYPGVLDFSAASQISLPQGGEVSDADFHVQRVPAVTVHGRLFGPGEEFAGSQLQVVLAHNDGNVASFIDRTAATVDANTGRFEFHGVAPGAYLVVASQLHAGHVSGGRVFVDVSGSTPPQNVNLPLTPAFDITGAVQAEPGTQNKIPNMTIRLMPSEGLALGAQPAARVSADGSFQLSGLTPGLWEFTLDPLPEDLWIKSASFAGVEVINGQLNVSSGVRGPLHIVLGSRGAEIAGIVSQNNQPISATVVLAPAASEWQGLAQMYRSTKTQENGSFLFHGVRPGSYKLFAFEEVETFAWLDAEFLKPVESLGDPISLSEGDKAIRQLTPVPLDTLLPAR